MRYIKKFKESVSSPSERLSVKDIYNNNEVITLTKEPVNANLAMKYVQCLIEHKLKNNKDSEITNDFIDYFKQFYKK